MPAIKIPIGQITLGEEERKAINEVVDSNKISEGPKVLEFEKRWAEYITSKYAVATSSGTAAIIVGLMALQHYSKYSIKPGMKVITTPVTYAATANAIIGAGMHPVFADVEKDSFLIDAEKVEEVLRKNPGEYAAIIPVNVMGYPCDMDSILKLSKEYNVAVLEDCAQSHGTKYKGKRVGSIGDLADFSFYIAHNIQAGELGALTTNDVELRLLIRKLKANGRVHEPELPPEQIQKYMEELWKEYDEDLDARFTHDMIGYNMKTTEFQAAIALCQLKKADWIMQRRYENVKRLNEELQQYSHLFELPKASPDIGHFAYPLTIIGNKITRKKKRQELDQKGIENRPLFGSIPTQQPAYSFLRKEYTGKLPNAEHFGSRTFYIGAHQYLTEQDIGYVSDSFKEILKGW